ncbi:MAG: hypothetical protein Q8P83_00715 [bacterium]|nr:hypothetical protein [bacterium]
MTKKSEIMKNILSVLAVTGIVVVSLTMPNLLQIFGPRIVGRKKYNGRQLYGSLYNLKKSGYISMKQEGDKTIIKMTKRGIEKNLKFNLEKLKIKKQTSWDKKWRIVIFDIPENRKTNRNALSFKLKEIGFKPLQKSVWICPYPCEDEIDFIKEMYEIRPYVRIITADSIDTQYDLIKSFNL